MLHQPFESIVMPLLGADPINQAFGYLAGNPAAAALLSSR